MLEKIHNKCNESSALSLTDRNRKEKFIMVNLKSKSTKTLSIVLAFVLLLSLITFVISPQQPALAAANPGFVTVYPVEPGAVFSDRYTVFVNNIQVPVYAIGSDKNVSYATFDFAGAVTVRVHVNQTVTSYDLSPHGYAVASTVSGQDITFQMDTPRKLLLKFTGIPEDLCIFGNPPEENPPKIGDAGVTSIMSYGVDNTGATNNLTQIQNAINALPANGILYFPAGSYQAAGILYMKSNTSIYLAGGACIKAGPYSSTALQNELQLNFNNVTNMKLFGRGSIDGRGDLQRAKYGGAENGRTLLQLDSGCNSSYVTIQDIIVKDPVVYTAIVMATDHWTVSNYKSVASKTYSNRDGFDPHNATNLMFDNNFIYGSDDALAMSTTVANLTLNDVFRNSVLVNNGNGAIFRIGPWISASASGIKMENCDGILSGVNEYAFPIYASGSLSNVKYMDNRIQNARSGVFGVYTNWNDYYAGPQNGSLSGVTIDRLYVEQAGNHIYTAPKRPASMY